MVLKQSLENYPCEKVEKRVCGKKDSIVRYFMGEFGCDSPDEGVPNVIDGNGKIDKRVVKYLSHFFAELGGSAFTSVLGDVFSAQYETAKGKAIRIYMTPQHALELRGSSLLASGCLKDRRGGDSHFVTNYCSRGWG